MHQGHGPGIWSEMTEFQRISPIRTEMEPKQGKKSTKIEFFSTIIKIYIPPHIPF